MVKENSATMTAVMVMGGNPALTQTAGAEHGDDWLCGIQGFGL